MTHLRRLCVAVTLVLAGSSSLALAETIRLRGDPWCPYNCAPGDKLPGFAIEMTQKIFKPLGVEVDYAILPWARALDAVRRGEIEGVVGADPDGEEGKGLVFPNETIGYSTSVLIVPAASDFAYGGVASLEKLILGATLGYSYERDIDAYIEANKARSNRIQLASGDNPLQTNLAKLDAGRIGAILETDYVARYALKSGQAKSPMKIVGMGTEATSVKIGFSPANPKSKAWALTFDQGVAQLRQSGELAAILAKYSLEDWGKSPTAGAPLVR